MSTWSPATPTNVLRGLGGGLRPGLRADGHSPLHGGRGVGRTGGLRRGIGDGDRGPDDRHGRRHGRAHGLRLDDDHAHLATRSTAPATPTSSTCRSTCATGRINDGLVVAGAGELGRQQGRLDHGRHLPGGGAGDADRGRAGAHAEGPAQSRRAAAAGATEETRAWRNRLLNGRSQLPTAGPAPAAVAAPARRAVDPADAAAGIVRLAVSSSRRLPRVARRAAALAELRRAMRSRDDAGLGRPERRRRRSRWRDVADILGLHPLLVEDLAERDQRAKLEQVDGAAPPGPLLARLRRRQHLRARARLRAGRPLPAQQPQRLVGSARDAAPADGPGDGHGPRHSTTCCGPCADDMIDSYFPILDRLGRRDRRPRGRGRRQADRALLERLFELKRELIQIRRVTAPEREMFNILSSREESAHLGRAAALLPRRLRPPDPPDRRARHLPRAGLGDAGDLPLHGQQQPLG